jgi:hypothetical protein
MSHPPILERPLPQPITPEAKPYWDGLRERQAHAPQLPDCATASSIRGSCPALPASRHRLDPVERPGQALLLRDLLQTLNKAFKVKPPYVLAHDRAREGPRMMSNLDRHRPDPKQIRCDMPVEVVYEKLTTSHPAPVPARGGRAVMKGAPATPRASSASTRATSSASCPTRASSPCTSRRSRNAVRDAGLKVSDVDGIFTAGQHSPATFGEALGIVPATWTAPRWAAAPSSSWSGHALVALHHGLCDVAVVCHGESGRSGVGVTPRRDTAIPGPVRGALRLRRRLHTCSA